MSVWNTSTPAGSDLLSQGDDVIRLAKQAIQEALRAGEVAGDDIEGVEAIFPGSSPSTAPVYRYRGLKGTTAERPTAGQYGLYYDTDRKVLQRDNGTSWDDIGQNIIPSGTKMVFYQASAPVNWTAVAVNDKFLRVVTAGGTGGSTGGTVAASTSLAHSHTVAGHTHTGPSHTHSISSDGSHSHSLYLVGGEGVAYGASYANSGSTDSQGSHTHGGVTGSSGTGVTGSSTAGTDSQLGVFAYADVVVASKD